MKINEYQKAVRKTINNELDKSDQTLNFSLGLSGETGEVIDLIKKEFFQGHKRNNEKLKDEIGDVFWYLANLCNELGYDIETILDINIEKLNKRYPEGFKKEDSENRKNEEDKGYFFVLNGMEVDADGNSIEEGL